MPAKYILAVLGVAFLAAALLGIASGRPRPQTRAWLIVGGTFLLVTVWLFRRS